MRVKGREKSHDKGRQVRPLTASYSCTVIMLVVSNFSSSSP